MGWSLTWGERDDYEIRLVVGRDDGRIHIVTDEPRGDFSLTCCSNGWGLWKPALLSDISCLGDLCPDCVVGLAELVKR